MTVSSPRPHRCDRALIYGVACSNGSPVAMFIPRVVIYMTFSAEALNLGASTVIAEKEVKVDTKINFLVVDNIKLYQAELLKKYYHKQLSQYKIIGVTGTNGKTSTSTYIYKYLRYINEDALLISSLGFYLDDLVFDTNGKYNIAHTDITSENGSITIKNGTFTTPEFSAPNGDVTLEGGSISEVNATLEQREPDEENPNTGADPELA